MNPESEHVVAPYNPEWRMLERRLRALAEPIDRAALKMALEQRCKDWRERLRSDYPEEVRFIVQQLIGPLTLWVGRAEDLEIADGFDADDDRGTENIDFEDCGFKAVVTPYGLLNGLGAFNVVAGARSRRYLQLWSGAA